MTRLISSDTGRLAVALGLTALVAFALAPRAVGSSQQALKTSTTDRSVMRSEDQPAVPTWTVLTSSSEDVADSLDGIHSDLDARNRVTAYGAARPSADDISEEYLTAFVGDFSYRWPYRTTSIYRPIPAWRYNRVEGLVIGLGKQPLEWDAYERLGGYGQVGYPFGSKRVQYEIGAEGRLGQRYGEEGADVKVGGAFRRLTATDDLWKSSWAENTIGAFFFNYDLFDYFETQGWTAYVAAKANAYVQFTAGFRWDEYHSLGNETGWSLFGGDHFRFNPPVSEGRMHSLVVVLEGGQVSRFHSLPSGHAFRIEGEIGKGLGGDFSFNRISADGRLYVRTTHRSSLALRGIVGVGGGTVPIQKNFSIGGVGSVRGYPQNAFRGSRTVVVNAEYTSRMGLADGLFDGIHVAGFFDAGWVSSAIDRSFSVSEMFTSAGVGVGFFERRLRLELAFPLTDRGGSKDPSLWLRLIPAF